MLKILKELAMVIYKNQSMVQAKDIAEINSQLRKYGSKVKEQFLDGKAHALANILYNACNEKANKVSRKVINSIKGNNFKINYIETL